MKICENCKTENKDTSKYCINCGNNIEEAEIFVEKNAIYCPNCGYEKKDDYFFCSKCGSILDVAKAKNVEEAKKTSWDQTEDVKEVIEVKTNNTNSLAKLTSILGLISLIAFFVPIGLPFSIVISLFAIAIGIVSLIRKPKVDSNKAIRGIILASISFVLSVVVLVCMKDVIAYLSEMIESYCFANSGAEECVMLKELLPGLFN